MGNSLRGMSPRITTAHHLQVSHFTAGNMEAKEVEAEGSGSHDFPPRRPSFWQDVPIRDELAVILQPGRVSESPGAIAPPHSPPTEVWIQSLGVWKIYDFNQNLMVCLCSVLKTDVWEPLVWKRTLQKQMEDFSVFMYLFSHPHKNLKHYENPREHCMGSLNVTLNDMKINGH